MGHKIKTGINNRIKLIKIDTNNKKRAIHVRQRILELIIKFENKIIMLNLSFIYVDC